MSSNVQEESSDRDKKQLNEKPDTPDSDSGSDSGDSQSSRFKSESRSNCKSSKSLKHVKNHFWVRHSWVWCILRRIKKSAMCLNIVSKPI